MNREFQSLAIASPQCVKSLEQADSHLLLPCVLIASRVATKFPTHYCQVVLAVEIGRTVNMSLISFASQHSYKPLNGGHRGFKGKYPENSYAAFEGAIEAGADIIETDIQVSADGEVVIQHDPSTGRCFNADYLVSKTDYHPTLEGLVMKDSPSQRMPLFKDVARLFAKDPRYSNVLLMLDVKRSNEPSVIAKVVQILKEINPDMSYWATRMVYGIWKLSVLEAAEKVSPEIPVVFIGVQRSLARTFMQHKQVVGISMLYFMICSSGGDDFIQEVRKKGKLIYAWTVNSPEAMKWAVSANLDGIVTDYPDRYNAFLSSLTSEEKKQIALAEPSSFFPLFFRVVTQPAVYTIVELAVVLFTWLGRV